jgi:hypothetical protein
MAASVSEITWQGHFHETNRSAVALHVASRMHLARCVDIGGECLLPPVANGTIESIEFAGIAYRC